MEASQRWKHSIRVTHLGQWINRAFYGGVMLVIANRILQIAVALAPFILMGLIIRGTGPGGPGNLAGVGEASAIWTSRV
jgi:hypothetical protein